MAQSTAAKKFEEEGVDDLVLLPKVTNEGIMLNLHKRYTRDRIYTNIGPVLVSVNPFRWIKGLCDDENVLEYKGRFRYEVQPNIFALAEDAYREMKNQQENQCIIITGESGAGKTEAAKLIMKYIAAVSGNAQDIAYVKDIIMDSNPLLEAFGNAKTLRNNNSSRFGKYFEIQFNRVGDPCGGHISHYLLEKTRVVSRLKNERSFHIFYQLLAGADQQTKQHLVLGGPQDFHYLNLSECYTVDHMDDTKEWNDVMHAMRTLNFTPEENWAILRIIAGILHLGNIHIGQDDRDQCNFPQGDIAIQQAAAMWDLQPAVLKAALSSRTVQTRNSTYTSPNNRIQAIGARDSLCSAIYTRVFDYLIHKTNIALQKYGSQKSVVIGVLDIYGFEIFTKNGFEQFCINYVNEKLQQFFIELTLKAEQEEYEKEGIKWTPIKYFNNKVVCDLIEAKTPSPGVFSLLDDVCSTMHAVGSEGGIDMKFLEKCTQFISATQYWWRQGDSFTVKHYAGEVNYHSEGFCEKNKDVLYPDLIQAMQSSQLAFLRERFPEDVSDKQQKRPPSAGFKIRQGAGELMKALSACSPHYVRCIKPNDTKKPQDWDEKRVEHQVQYLGLLENVRVRRAGFAFRAPFARFLDRYKKLNKKTWSRNGEWSGDPKEGCRVILSETPLGEAQWQLGNSKVFIRHPESLFYLEESLERFDYDAAMAIQKAYRKLVARKHAMEQKTKAANLLKGKKDRRSESKDRRFEGDYMRYDQNYGLQNSLGPNKDERVVFADQVLKVNRRLRVERRDFILSVEAFYLVMRATKMDQQFYKVSARVPLSSIQEVVMSTLQDNFIVFVLPSEDIVIENDKKTEMLAVLLEYYHKYTGRELTLKFSDTITYKLASGDTRSLVFSQDQSTRAKLKKSGKMLRISICPGIGKDADTAPKGLAAPTGGGRAFTPNAAPFGGQKPAQGGFGQPAFAQPAATATGGFGQMQPAYAQPAATATANPMATNPMATNPFLAAQQQQAAHAHAAHAAAAQAVHTTPQIPVQAPPPPVPQADTRPKCKALYPHQGQSATELSFQPGDVIIILRKDPGGWWEGELNGKRGWVPHNYVQEI